jgi:adenylate cyclase class IV
VHEMNTLFDSRDGVLAKKGKLVRIRVVRPAPLRKRSTARGVSREKAGGSRAAILTYKGPAQASGQEAANRQLYKVREEHELQVSDSLALEQVLAGMGLQPSFRYEKYRSTYRLSTLPGLLIELDETPIGNFLELEGVRDEIDSAAVLLGFSPADYVAKSYGELFVESRGAAARSTAPGSSSPAGRADMLFDTSHSSAVRRK